MARNELSPAIRDALIALVEAWEAALAPAPAEQVVIGLRNISVMMPNRDSADDLAVRMAAYAEDLQGVPNRLFQAAMVKLRREVSFFPTLAEIRKAMAELMAPERPMALRAYAARWLADNPKQPGWTDEEWWNLRAMRAAMEWGRERGICE